MKNRLSADELKRIAEQTGLPYIEVTAESASEAEFFEITAPCILEMESTTEHLCGSDVLVSLVSCIVNGTELEDMPLPFDNYVDFKEDALIVYGAKNAGGPAAGNHSVTVRIPWRFVSRMTIQNID